MDAYLRKVLDHFRKSVKKKWDFVLLITGMEGSAKSTLAKCIGYYMTKKFSRSNRFTVDNVVFTPQQFNDIVDKLPPGSVIVWDEFVLGGLSTDMSAVQNTIIQKFTMIRKKQLVIILVIPFIWMLRTYFAIARTKVLIDVYSPNFLDRGYYRVWGFKSKKELYFRGSQQGSKWSYKVKPDFHGRFGSDIAQHSFFIDDDKYEKKKDLATQQFMDQENKKEEEVKKDPAEEIEEKLKGEGLPVTGGCKRCKAKVVRVFKDEEDRTYQKCLACSMLTYVQGVDIE